MKILKRIILLSMTVCIFLLSACSTPHTQARTAWDRAWIALRDKDQQAFTDCFSSPQDAEILYASFANARAAAAQEFEAGTVVYDSKYVTASESVLNKEPVSIMTLSFKTSEVSGSEQTLDMILSASFKGTGKVDGETVDVSVPLFFVNGMFLTCYQAQLPDPSMSVCLITTSLSLSGGDWKFKRFVFTGPQ